MNRSQIEASKKLAQEFITAADAALERLDAELVERNERHGATSTGWLFEEGPDNYSYGSKETGALKRKSMDLTRSLAVLRK